MYFINIYIYILYCVPYSVSLTYSVTQITSFVTGEVLTFYSRAEAADIMGEQLSPDEKFQLITRNLQVWKSQIQQLWNMWTISCVVSHSEPLKWTKFVHRNKTSNPSYMTCCELYVLSVGGSWWGEIKGDLEREGGEGLLGYGDHRQTPCGLFCSHVKGRRFPEGGLRGLFLPVLVLNDQVTFVE